MLQSKTFQHECPLRLCEALHVNGEYRHYFNPVYGGSRVLCVRRDSEVVQYLQPEDRTPAQVAHDELVNAAQGEGS